jgi:hypothetical protein
MSSLLFFRSRVGADLPAAHPERVLLTQSGSHGAFFDAGHTYGTDHVLSTLGMREQRSRSGPNGQAPESSPLGSDPPNRNT